ncbi:monosaccharide ABC transporter membrane protein, CUT2 family [Octadecabacter temperatus]|uniref:Ribose transport system permease protein RbsC n=1 Tax=Octadecabacter temperatus TaxID=1458307 RepID=A0A0K0Y867_9RHOB|nr:ABC transporter permease [Octadecabacter temperatus]AKS47164.1 Ribose transport system permease protein RbsC [Octadecabacter temperatus]SIO45796.1 monosaccharide ABC transporter membrane protein, CUT2 family [Octadecabacter temperatus]
MSDASEGTGGLTYDKSKRHWPNELNVFAALVLIVIIFEILGAIFMQQSLLFDTRDRFDSIFNEARLRIIIIQVAIIGIIALGVTQVIITAGIDLSSGSVVGATAMIAMSFAQVAEVNGGPNPKAIFGEWALDLPVVIPILVGLSVGMIAGIINGLLVAYSRIPPFIATLGMMLFARGVAQWWSLGNPVSFPTESYAKIGAGMMPVIIFLSLAVLFHFIMNYTVYGKHTYAIGSNEAAARMSGINVPRHLVLVYLIAGGLAGLAAVILTSKNLTAQSGMGLSYELEAIAMAVIGGVSLFGGRGSIIGTVIGALIIGVITSGFTFLRLGAYYQEMVLGIIIVGAVALDQWQQKRAAARA